MTRKILIAYDLNQPGRDYPRITGRIKELGNAGGGWCHPLESTWLILTPATAIAVRDDLLNYTDASSRLLVVDVTGSESAWSGMETDVSDWLKAN